MKIQTHVLTCDGQELSESRKNNARKNIGAAKLAENAHKGDVASFDEHGELVGSAVKLDNVVESISVNNGDKIRPEQHNIDLSILEVPPTEGRSAGDVLSIDENLNPVWAGPSAPEHHTHEISDINGLNEELSEIHTEIDDVRDSIPTTVAELSDSDEYAKKTDLPEVPSKLSELSDDSTHRLVTDEQINTWNTAEENVQADWNETDTESDAYIENKPDLAAVATTGSFTDLLDKPVIDTALDSTSGNAIANSAVATEISSIHSDLDAMSDALTTINRVIPEGTASGNELTNKENVANAIEEAIAGIPAQQQSDWNQSNTDAVDYIKNKPNNLVQDADYVHTDNNYTTDEKTKLGGIESGADVNVQSDWNETDTTSDAYIKNKPAIPPEVIVDQTYSATSTNAQSGISVAQALATVPVQAQSDWNQTNLDAVDYIKNKPANLVQDSDYVHTDNNYTTDEKTKLSGIESGAKVNVQSDWNVTDTTSDAYIKNKPAIPPEVIVDQTYSKTSINAQSGTAVADAIASIPAQKQSDWNQTNTDAVDYIKNKPTIPPEVIVDQTYGATSTNAQSGTAVADAIASIPAQKQSDWNQTNTDAVDYIKNKPNNLVQDSDYVHTDNNYTTDEKTKLSGIASGADVNVQSDWNETDTTSDSYILNKPTIPPGVVVDQTYSATSTNAQSGTAVAQALATVPAQAQSDWNQTNAGAVDFIKNKPNNLVQDANYVHTDNNYTTDEKTKLGGIESGADVNVQSDWNETDTTSDAYIKNKPTIPPGVVVDQTYSASSTNAQSGTAVAEALATLPTQTQSDWNQSDSTAVDYIKNKPANLVQDSDYVHTDNNYTAAEKTKLSGIASGADVNVQSDWNETDTTSDSYILNKPSIPVIGTITIARPE